MGRAKDLMMREEEQGWRAGGAVTGTAQFSVSDTGSLNGAWLPRHSRRRIFFLRPSAPRTPRRRQRLSCYAVWWPVFRCPSVAGFGCPPRRTLRALDAYDGAMKRRCLGCASTVKKIRVQKVTVAPAGPMRASSRWEPRGELFPSRSRCAAPAASLRCLNSSVSSPTPNATTSNLPCAAGRGCELGVGSSRSCSHVAISWRRNSRAARRRPS